MTTTLARISIERIGMQALARYSGRCLTNRASAAGASSAGAPCARSFYATRQAHKRNSSLLGRARQLQALVRRRRLRRSSVILHDDRVHPLIRSVLLTAREVHDRWALAPDHLKPS